MSISPIDTPAAGSSPRHLALPLAAGIGLKHAHGQGLLDTLPPIGFVEIHAENYMGDGGPPHRLLERLRSRYALSVHGVGLSIGGEAPLDQVQLARLERLIDRHAPEMFSEHLAWSSHDGTFFNDLLPIAYTTPALHRVVAHVDEVQDRLGRRMLLENPATYVAFATSSWDEPAFIAEIVKRTGCGLLLDVNHVLVSCTNHRHDPHAYLDAIPLQTIGEIHLAGHAPEEDAAGAPLLIDTHGCAVAPEVWDLYARVLERAGPRPTLIEWDDAVPALETLLAEAAKAEARIRRARPERIAARG
jgi:uncharacterized protein